MQIITALPGEGAVKDALIREIRTGFELIKANEKKEEILAAQEAQQWKGHRTIPGLGKAVAFYPRDEYFRLIAKYGRKEINSNEFIRYHQKKFPHLCPNKV
jgi:hypothetical protein